jgi:hypothetical protein
LKKKKGNGRDTNTTLRHLMKDVEFILTRIAWQEHL